MHEPPDKRRTRPVRLTDIPEPVRLTAAQQACRVEATEEGRTELLLAALFPSRTVYWIAT